MADNMLHTTESHVAYHPPSPLPCVDLTALTTARPACSAPPLRHGSPAGHCAMATVAQRHQHSNVPTAQDARAEMRFFEEPTHGALLLRAPWRLHETGLSQSLTIYHSAHAGSS